jgi:uncharacterized repeat protein (TIGR03803 family)
MTYYGGANDSGCIFSIDTNGSNFKNLLNFSRRYGTLPDGSLTLSGGILYGTATFGGANDSGCIFAFDPNLLAYIDLFDFTGASGGKPEGSLTVSGSTLYGSASEGGANGSGCIFSINKNGSGGYKDLFDFDSFLTGETPFANVTLSGGILYGMTYIGGLYNNGCIFSIDTNGNGYNDLFNFHGAFGANPLGSLSLSGNMLYGMTWLGGTNDGVVFGFNTTATGISQVTSIIEAINVYPNPSNGTFTVSVSNIKEKCNVEVYNIVGEKIYNETLPQTQSDNTINLTGQPSGIYFYRVLKETGALVGSGKLIIEK